MSSINYGQLAGEAASGPTDGLHDAYLMRARLQTGAQDFIVTEWQAGGFYWETLYGFTPQRLGFTQEMLDGLGIDRAKVTDDDALEAALADAQGSQYRVRVERNGRFTNTYIEGGASGAQRSFESDIPADTSGLPDASRIPPAEFERVEAEHVVVGSTPVDLTDDELNDIFR